MVVPSASASPSSSARTPGVSRTGHSYAASRDTACASSATALSGAGLEPCPAVPRAVSFIQVVPRSPVAIG